ncbi:FUSC family membrane protein, partial [Salmonella enterica]|uniref:FUSC family membrane protein n=1 Tax=Salmonella enterica TaxID=28901 RepID=UPI00398C5936
PIHARVRRAPLIAASFTLGLSGYMPVWEALRLYALGTLWEGVFHWFWFWLWRDQPLRESLSLLYRELADYCEAKSSLLTQHMDQEKVLPPLLTRMHKAVELITTCHQQLTMIPVTNTNDYMRLRRHFQDAMDFQDP